MANPAYTKYLFHVSLCGYLTKYSDWPRQPERQLTAGSRLTEIWCINPSAQYLNTHNKLTKWLLYCNLYLKLWWSGTVCCWPGRIIISTFRTTILLCVLITHTNTHTHTHTHTHTCVCVCVCVFKIGYKNALAQDCDIAKYH